MIWDMAPCFMSHLVLRVSAGSSETQIFHSPLVKECSANNTQNPTWVVVKTMVPFWVS